MKRLIYLLLLTFPIFLFAQAEKSKISLDLHYFITNCDADQMIPLLVESTVDLSARLEQYGGSVQMKINHYYSIRIPAKNIKDFSELSFIKRIGFSSAPGKLLNDSMRVNNNIDSLAFIPKKWPSSYTGEGVIMGIIDSGIDFSHPDFKDSLGNTRILYIWDQSVPGVPSRAPQPYAYGLEWDSTDINNGICTHVDPSSSFGHGSMVAGAAAGNALATGKFKGVASNSDLIVVATDFNRTNWLQSVAEAVDYIFKKADSLNKACVINISAGSYFGSHDGMDIAAEIIDILIKSKNGRAVVAAAGNAGNKNFHLGYTVTSDTNFTWFEYAPNILGQGGIYFKLYADTADFKNVFFSVAADQVQGTYSKRAEIPFRNIAQTINQVKTDTLKNKNGQKIALVQTYAEENKGVYSMEVAIVEIDSTLYKFRFSTVGNGHFDLWSSLELTGSSDMVMDSLPTPLQFPPITYYKKADSLQTMVSSFTCLPSVVSVGNYTNRNSYLDANLTIQYMNANSGEISINSSLGPNRKLYPKPDIAAAGDFMLSAGKIALIDQLLQTEPSKIAADSMHMRNGGTSMAAPGVAGIIALYFEKCPNANYAEILNALKQSAKKDKFTSTTYSPKWGFGKIDALAMLKSSNFFPAISSSTTSVCEGDTAYLSAANSYKTYQWSNNDSTSVLEVGQTGSYYLLAENNSACKAYSDTIEVQFLPSPAKPVIRESNDSLFSSGTAPHQWYLNGQKILGANNYYLVYRSSGKYVVESIDTSNSCSSFSDPHTIIVSNIKEYSSCNCKVYPNPGSELFSLDCGPDEITGTKILDLRGRIVYSSENKIKQPYVLNLGLLNEGIYFLYIQSKSSGHFIQKITVQ